MDGILYKSSLCLMFALPYSSYIQYLRRKIQSCLSLNADTTYNVCYVGTAQEHSILTEEGKFQCHPPLLCKL